MSNPPVYAEITDPEVLVINRFVAAVREAGLEITDGETRRRIVAFLSDWWDANEDRAIEEPATVGIDSPQSDILEKATLVEPRCEVTYDPPLKLDRKEPDIRKGQIYTWDPQGVEADHYLVTGKPDQDGDVPTIKRGQRRFIRVDDTLFTRGFLVKDVDV